MKVKELDRTVNVAWSPPSQHPILLATGTAAQQLDASFNTSAALELYALNLNEAGLDMELKVSVPSQHRFHKVSWGGSGTGVVVGGCDSGKIQVYSVPKLLGGEDSLLVNQDRHSGPVRTLDFNPFQSNLLASGASESEIYIWDLNNTSTPMTPGAKPQPFEDVVWLSWNKQVQHILASSFPTRCIVWDLRKNEPIIKLSDSTSRVRWKVVAWHPDVATQLCLASEDDANPVVQLWDLRFATSPLKVLQGHSRGVLTMAWCNQDPDLLISSGKDSRILCWNPNSNEPNGEIVCEIANSQQVIFELSWCPRNPSLIASCSCDGHASVYSLTGSQNQVQTTNKIAESFPGMENMSGSEPPPQHPTTVDLRKPPKWLRRPVGASFGFGGKLVSFGRDGVTISKVKTEDDFLTRARFFEEAISTGRAVEICRGHSDPLWTYLEATFSSDPRTSLRCLLGFEKPPMIDDLGRAPANLKQNCDIDGLTDHMSTLNQNILDGCTQDFIDNSGSLGNFGNSLNSAATFDKVDFSQGIPEKKIPPFKISTDNDINGKICQALLVGGVEEAVEICLQEKRMADAIILSIAAGPELLAKTQMKYFQETDGYLSHLIEAVVTEDWKKIVSSCELSSWKEALAAILTYCKEEDLPSLCEELGSRLEAAGGSDNMASAEVCYIASGNMSPLIERRTVSNSFTPETIQELVELVLVSEQALGGRGGSLCTDECALLLSLYSELLASQGDLQIALRFISNINHEITEGLKERLYFALGHKTLYQQPQQLPQQLPQQNFTRKTSVPGGVGHIPPKPPTPVGGSYQAQPAFNRVAPSSVPPPPSTAPAMMTRNTPSPHQTTGKKYVVDPSVQGGYRSNYSQGGSVPMFQQPGFAPQPTATNFSTPGATTFQPPGVMPFQPPGAASFHPPGAASFQPLGSASFQPPGSASFQPPGAVPFQPPGAVPFQPPGASVFGNTTGPTAFTPPSPFTSSAQPHFPPQSNFNAPPVSSSSSFQPSMPSLSGPITSQPSSSFPSGPGPNQNLAPQSTFSQKPHEFPKNQQPSQPSLTPSSFQQQPVPFSAPQNVSKPSVSSRLSAQISSPISAPGWNDPPVLSGSPRNQPKAEVAPQNPITHPLFGASAPQQAGQVYGSGAPQQGYSGGLPQQMGASFPPPPPQSQQVFNPGQQQPQQTFSPPPPSQQNYLLPSQTQLNSQPFTPISPTAAKQQAGINGGGFGDGPPKEGKPPLPQRYAHMQSVFQDLRSRASLAASNPQSKRKLEEVGRKLEAMFDALRDSRLSSNTVSSLEQMVALIEKGEYRGALELHTKMASGPDFSQIASFMPGLKVLIQSSLQLGVYLQ